MPEPLPAQKPNCSDNASAISIAALTVQYADNLTTLNELSLEIFPGEIIALLGASGCGKSTLLKTIAGLIEPRSGSVKFTGKKPLRRTGDMSYVFQDPTLLPWRSVEENVRLPLELGLRPAQTSQRSLDETGSGEVRQRVASVLQSVGLEPTVFRQFPRELSGGMKMRASIARALITDPTVLLLDEPFAALDDLLRTRMNELVLQLWQDKCRTIVFVTHNIAEAVYLSHRVAVLGGGKVSHLLENPLPWPRTSELRTKTEFAEFYGNVSGSLAKVAS